MNIRYIEMVESSAEEYSGAEVLFLRFGRNIPPKKHHTLGLDNSLFRPIDRLAVLCMDI